MATLNELLVQLTSLEDQLSVDIDPAELIGEIRGKVDGIKAITERMTGLAGELDLRRAWLSGKVAALNNNVKRLKAYVAAQMQDAKLERLPGKTCYVRLQSSPVALKILRPVESDDLVANGRFVDVVFVWKKDLIKEEMLSGRLEKNNFAEVERGQHVRFYEAVPAYLQEDHSGPSGHLSDRQES